MPRSVSSVIFVFCCVAAIIAVTETALSQLGSGPHIADVNILLPPKMTFPVEYRLQGSDGCFKWTWDHHDILSVLPEYNSSSRCSTSARLRSIAPFAGRQETAVYASDVRTGSVIRIKVFIDSISRIQIFHNSIKLDLDGLATLRVRAFDREDNVFSSLVGLQFKWELKPEGDESNHQLVHVPLKDSPLSDCSGFCGDLNIQIMLEDNGVFSDLFVVKGIGIGHESVSAKLLEPQYKHMADKIVLTVAEAMSLEPPSPVFVLIGAAFRYTLKVIRANVPQVVTLPSTHHRWSIYNSSVAEVDSIMGFVRAHNLGVTTVVAEDTRVAGHIQVSSLNVVIPKSLYLYITALSSSGELVEGSKSISSMIPWYVVSGREYLIEMKVFSSDPDRQEIYITESDDLKLHEKQSDYWTSFPLLEKLADKYERRNPVILKATAEGLGELTASLRYSSGDKETKEVLKVVQEITVCQPVKFSLDGAHDTPHLILLPWAPGVYQEVELKVTGGCAKGSSDYKWFTSDVSILSILTSGIVQAKKPGKATVKVVSEFDPFNFDEVIVEVAFPSSMNMLQKFSVETVVGSYLQAAVTMKASNGAHFYKCDAFHPYIKWKVGSESFVVVNSIERAFSFEAVGFGDWDMPSNGTPCSWTTVYASGSGETMLHATLSKEYDKSGLSSHGPLALKASTRIAAYPPLVVHQIGDGNKFGGYGFKSINVEASHQLESLEKLFLVPGTSVDIIILGGPKKWDSTINFNETIDVLDDKHASISNGVKVHHICGTDRCLYRILCQDLGAFELNFKRGNLVGDDHPLPAIAEIELPLTCSLPSSIALIVDEPANSRDVIRTAALADRSTGRVRVSPITVANGRSIRIAAVSISDLGEAFSNSSSLSLKWELSSCEGLAYWDDAYERSRFSWEKFLVLQNGTGKCFLRASVAGFIDVTGSQFSSKLVGLGDMLTDAVHLQLVSTLRVSPEYYLLFVNPDAKVNLSISGGSCFWEASVNDSQVVKVVQSPQSLQCIQLTLSPKGLGTAFVTIHDVGLAPPTVASAMVQVADVDWIKIVSEEEISLMEGRSESIALMAGTADGSIFDPLQYAFMTIRLIIEDDIVELEDNDNFRSPSSGFVNAASFRIIAKSLGVTTLYVSARQHTGHEIHSQPIKIEVYAPLRLHPSDIFLAPGASYLLSVRGGPTIGVHVEYASEDDGIATVDRLSGRLSALSPGNTTIISMVYGKRGAVVCQAYSSIRVGVPPSAIVNVQSEQLDIGREMSIYASFPEGDPFSFYGLCTSYQWSVDDEKVSSFYNAENLYDENHWLLVNNQKGAGFIKVIHGRSPGKTDIAVTFSCDFISASYSHSQHYEASITLLVVPKLPLALGTHLTWVLPPHYISSPLLPSSFGSHGQFESQGHKGTITYTLLKSCGERELWQKESISIDGDRIRTTESNNLACIQAKDRTTGRTEIASCVRTAEVVQISIRNKDHPFHSVYLPVGAELDLQINYFDALGNPFYEAYDIVPHQAETNYHDVVSIEDATDGDLSIHLKARRHGETLVRVSMKNIPQKSDYILVSVGTHVFPQNPVLHQGSSLNLSLQGANDQISGRWHSANQSIISIDMLSGKAQAIEIGSTEVLFESPTMKVQTTVTVVPGDTVSIEAPKDIVTNVPYPTKGYSFPVQFSNNYKKIDSVGDGKVLSYDCKVDPPFIGYAKPWIDFVTGNSYCLFFPYSPEHLARSVHKLEGMKPYVYLSINASLREANGITGSASALFIGGFSILEMDKGSMHLNLSPDFNRTTLSILGNTDVEIHWHERDLLNIIPVDKEAFGIGGRALYEVKVLKPKRFKDKIVISLPANGQRVEIDVLFEPKLQTSPSSFSTPIMVGVLTLISLAFGLLFFTYMMSNRSQPPGPHVPTDLGIKGPHTPERRSPAVMEQSPRTPQPFVDYIRRTIDETPYYSREARRRFNPQNTY